jgi:hypothetical protein
LFSLIHSRSPTTTTIKPTANIYHHQTPKSEKSKRNEIQERNHDLSKTKKKKTIRKKPIKKMGT